MDPNYAHEFNPNRQGFCKSIIRGRICGLPEEWTAHIRFAEKEKELPFFGIPEVRESEDYDKLLVIFEDVRCTEGMRKWVEDAIREKLESL
jgi:hypothetical protein